MAKKPGERIDQNTTLTVDVAEDVTNGQVAKWSSYADPNVATIAGAGEMPLGVFEETVDYSEDGGRTKLSRGPSRRIVPCAAAITDLKVPVKVAASGTCTPCDTDQDIILGMPLNTQATVGGDVLVDLTLMGTYYAA